MIIRDNLYEALSGLSGFLARCVRGSVSGLEETGKD